MYKTCEEITRGLEEYDVASSIRSADAFLEALSTWYLRRSRRRFWKSTADEDKSFAYRTLFHVLVTFCESLAPLLPFVTEEIYRNLTGSLREKSGWPESVHLRAWPDIRRDLVDPELNARMDQVLSAVRLGRSAREKVQIRVRQPLSRLWILSVDGTRPGLDDDLRGQIAQELNVKEVLLDGRMIELVRREVKLNFPVLGAKLGPAMKEVSKAAREGTWNLRADGMLEIGGQTLAPGEYDLQFVGVGDKAAAQDRGLVVVLDTVISDALRREGYAREIVRCVQDLRKQAGYNVEDRIALCYRSSDPRVAEVFSQHGGTIGEETLATRIHPEEETVDQSDELKLDDGLTVWVGVRKGS